MTDTRTDTLQTTSAVTPSGLTVCYVQINKCASSSVSRALGIPPKQHLTAQELRARMGEAWHGAFTFAVVRNPYDRVVSQYEYRKARGGRSGFVGDMTFRQWVHGAYDLKDPKLVNNEKMFRPCVWWLRDEAGRMMVAQVYKAEKLWIEWAGIARHLGVSESLPRANTTERRPYREYYDDGTRRIIARVFAEDLKRFDYTF